jgi:hypothetical protein
MSYGVHLPQPITLSCPQGVGRSQENMVHRTPPGPVGRRRKRERKRVTLLRIAVRTLERMVRREVVIKVMKVTEMLTLMRMIWLPSTSSVLTGGAIVIEEMTKRTSDVVTVMMSRVLVMMIVTRVTMRRWMR